MATPSDQHEDPDGIEAEAQSDLDVTDAVSEAVRAGALEAYLKLPFTKQGPDKKGPASSP